MWLLLIVGLLSFALFFLLKPATNRNGGSLDSFIREEKDEGGEEKKEKKSDPYKRTFVGAGNQLLLLFGTEYGFSEQVAKRLYDEILKIDGMQPRLVNMAHYTEIDFAREQVVFLICSTSGDGVPPSDARPFHDWISSESVNLSHLYFSTLALGDSAYPHFCRAGLSLHERFLVLSAKLFSEKATVDLEDWGVIKQWMEGCLTALKTLPLESRDDYLDIEAIGNDSQSPSRKNPFFGTMVVKHDVTSAAPAGEEEKQVIHCEFDLAGSSLSYTSGDALAIYPLNNPDDVTFLLAALRSHDPEITPDLIVQIGSCYAPAPEGNKLPLKDALLKYFDLKIIRPELIKYLAEGATTTQEKTKGEQLLELGLSLKDNPALASYISLREVGDAVEDFASSGIEVPTFLSLLRELQPRYYSISSSPSSSSPPSSRVSVTAAIVRYETLGKPRTGVCTTFLEDRMKIGMTCPLFISKNPEFRLPSSPTTPIIMIGPGTGIAPFRAFLQDRQLAATAESPMLAQNNLLYFGCRFKEADFLYKEELTRLETEGKLMLRVAFSREQKQKVYVQHLILQDSAMLWAMLQAGAHIYVCGDAKNMARDVQEALLKIFGGEGGMGGEEAERYLAQLEGSHRYQRDVWIT